MLRIAEIDTPAYIDHLPTVELHNTLMIDVEYGEDGEDVDGHLAG
jgi:fatty acid/phospholipid biosynthesis enzyme